MPRPTMSLLPALALAGAGVAAACVPPSDREPREPMGKLPGLVTTAEPEWMPRPVFAGEPLPSDPRERRLDEPRRIDPGGEALRVAWADEGRILLVETRAAGSACEGIVVVDLEGGAPRPLTASGSRGRLGAALPGGRVLLAEAECGEPPEKAAWALVDVDPVSGARRVVGRPDGEVLGVETDGRAAFVAIRDAQRRGRVDRVALEGGAARAVIDGTAAWSTPAIAAATATLVVVREVPAGGAQLVVASDQGGGARAWSRGTARDAEPSLSPDGRALVFASTRASGAKPVRADDAAQLYLGATEQGEVEGGPAPERLTFAGDDNRAPAVGPSGRALAWVSDRAAPGGPHQVIVARFDGEP